MKRFFTVGVFVLAAMAFSVGGPFATHAAEGEVKAEEAKKDIGTKVGQYLANFKVKTADGGDFEWKGTAGKPSVFVLIAPTCSLCMKEVAELQEYATDLAAKADVYVVVESNAAAAARFASKYKGDFTMLIDEDFVVMSVANFRVTPSTIVVDKDGKITQKFQQYTPGMAKDFVANL